MRKLIGFFAPVGILHQSSYAAVDSVTLALPDLMQHLAIVEALKFIGLYLGIPVLAAAAVYLIGKLEIVHAFLSNLKFRINQKRHEWCFEQIYRKEQKSDLERELIRSALNEASSSDVTKKTNAIAQLTQFRQEEAIVGLIKLLANEKHNGFRVIIIRALYAMTTE